MPDTPKKKPLISKAAPLSAEQSSEWNKLLSWHRKASYAIDSAGFLMLNIYTTYDFAEENKVPLKPLFNPEWENEWLEVKKSFENVKKGIRGVQDQIYGIRIRYENNVPLLDILKPTKKTFEGIIIPIAVGVVVVAAAVGASIWQYQRARALSKKYNDILKKTDDTLCSDMDSPLCKKWKKTKAKKNYVKNKTIADSLKTGISTIGKGLQIGLLFALPLAAWLIFGKRK